jgi:hypothetical protein
MIDADEWPYSFNTIAPAAQLHALGQITLVFNYLEESIGNIFKVAMPTNSAFSEAMYHKLNNRDRVDLLAAIVRESSKEDDIKEAILHLLTCYSICADNRNILMHAILESADADIISLSKKASRDPTRLIEFRNPAGRSPSSRRRNGQDFCLRDAPSVGDGRAIKTENRT